MVLVPANSIDKPLVVCVVYWPPKNTNKNITATGFFNQFSTLIEELHASADRRLLIVGDFNIHVDSKRNADAIKFISLKNLASTRSRHKSTIISTDEHQIETQKHYPIYERAPDLDTKALSSIRTSTSSRHKSTILSTNEHQTEPIAFVGSVFRYQLCKATGA